MAEGLTKSPDEIYCPECGRTIQRDSTKCSFCDTDFKKLFGSEEQQDTGNIKYGAGDYSGPRDGYPSGDTYKETLPQSYPVKSKTVAVVLAVFLGFWAWLYTFKNNSLKFWITLGVFGVVFIITSAYSCSIITDSMNYGGYGTNYFGGSFIGFIIFTNIINFGVWVWCVVDNAIKPESFYRNYPNGH